MDSNVVAFIERELEPQELDDGSITAEAEVTRALDPLLAPIDGATAVVSIEIPDTVSSPVR